MFYFFFCKQKTAYEMRISDWSSDVCSSDLVEASVDRTGAGGAGSGIDRGEVDRNVGSARGEARGGELAGEPRGERIERRVAGCTEGGTRRNAQRKIADWSIARIALADRTVEREIGRRFGEIDIDRTRSDKPLENGHVAGRFLVAHRREARTYTRRVGKECVSTCI